MVTQKKAEVLTLRELIQKLLYYDMDSEVRYTKDMSNELDAADICFAEDDEDGECILLSTSWSIESE